MITYPFLTTLVTASLLLLVPTAAGQEDEVDKKKGPVFPSACVKMAIYDNTKCDGHPQRVIMYPTWKKSGDSPCFHDPQLPFASVKDQYCDFKDQTYHLSLYPLSGECETNSYTQNFAPVKVAVPINTCYLGFKIEHCKKGPCIGDDEEDGTIVELGDESSVAAIIEQLLQANEDTANLAGGGTAVLEK